MHSNERPPFLKASVPLACFSMRLLERASGCRHLFHHDVGSAVRLWLDTLHWKLIRKSAFIVEGQCP